MKLVKGIMLAALVAVGLLSASNVMAACLADSGICWGNGVTTIESVTIGDATISDDLTMSASGVGLYSRTLAQINGLTPGAAGEEVYCNNCVNTAVCISSGTGVGAYVDIDSPTAHCDVL